MRDSQTAVLGLVLLAMTVIGCSVGRRDVPARSPGDLERLAGWMAGSFSSAEQSAEDSTYFDILLRMAPIWTERTDGCWLYVEQAVAGNEGKPYRQRVYHVTRTAEEGLQSRVFTLENPLRFTGAWRTPDSLDGLSPDSLSLREGCTIYLRRSADTSFAGSTRGVGCASELRGAKYATSEVVVTESELRSWDRGFDESGKQVWGATKGGYIFRKIEDWSGKLRRPAR